MLKKIGLYSLLFVVVALSTAAVIVFLNKQPNFGETEIPVVEQDMTLTNIMNATMNIDNYYGELELSNTSKTIDISGNVSLIDLAGKPSGQIVLNGKVNGADVRVRAKYKNNMIYASINNFGVQVAAGDLVELFEFATTVLPTGDTSILLDVDALLADLQSMQVTESENDISLALTLTGVGDVSLVANKDYLPISVSAKNIQLLGETFNLSFKGEQGKANAITVTTAESTSYINLSESKNLIKGLVNTAVNAPIILDGQVEIFGQTVFANILVDKQLNAKGTISLSNLSVDVLFFDEKLYLDVCGAKIVCSLDEMLELAAPYFNVDIEELLATLKLSKTSLSISDFKCDFGVDGDYVTSVNFSNELLNGQFSLTNTLPLSISKPEGFDEAISAKQVLEVVNEYYPLLTQNEFSLSIDGSFSNLAFDLNGYAKLDNNQIKQLYVGNKINSSTFHLWNDGKKSYVMFDTVKVKFDNAFATDMFEYAKDKFGIEMMTIDELLDLMTGELKSLQIEADGRICVGLKSGVFVEVYQSADDVYVKLNAQIAGETLDATVCVHQNNSKNKSIFGTLSPMAYQDLSGYASCAQDAIDTLINGHNKFSGSLVVTGPNGKCKFIEVSVELETWFNNGALEFALKLDNLPASSLISGLPLFKYDHQTAYVTYRNGVISVKRTASNKKTTDVLLEKTYRMEELSLGVVEDLIGLDGLLGKYISKNLDKAPEQQAQLDFSKFVVLESVDNGLAAKLKTSTFAKQLSDASVLVKTANGFIDQMSVSLNAWVNINLNLKREG